MIRRVRTSDTAEICSIYNHYITDTIVTFEEKPLSVNQMADRIECISAKFPYIIYELDGRLVGYAYVNTWNTRCSYRSTVESTVYVAKDFIGRGIGRKLLTALMDQVAQTCIHAVIASISLPNDASITLHENFGFEKVGVFKQVGNKFNNWIDVGYWQWTRGQNDK